MYDMHNVVKRLKMLLSNDENGDSFNDKRLAELLGISSPYLSRCKAENKVPFEKLAKLCFERRYDLNYVVFGDSPEPRNGEAVNNTVQIRMLSDVYGSCGGGGEEIGGNCEFITIDKRSFDGMKKDIDYSKVQAIKATGDSMEPVIKEGSTVFIDTTDTNISKNGIFTISTNDGIFIKRISKTVGGDIELISENSVYTVEKVSPEDIRVNGRVIAAIERI